MKTAGIVVGIVAGLAWLSYAVSLWVRGIRSEYPKGSSVDHRRDIECCDVDAVPSADGSGGRARLAQTMPPSTARSEP